MIICWRTIQWVHDKNNWDNKRIHPDSNIENRNVNNQYINNYQIEGISESERYKVKVKTPFKIATEKIKYLINLMRNV